MKPSTVAIYHSSFFSATVENSKHYSTEFYLVCGYWSTVFVARKKSLDPFWKR